MQLLTVHIDIGHFVFFGISKPLFSSNFTLYCSVALNAFLLTTCTCVQFVINICPVYVLYEW
jgi:hypothetical protein